VLEVSGKSPGLAPDLLYLALIRLVLAVLLHWTLPQSAWVADVAIGHRWIEHVLLVLLHPVPVDLPVVNIHWTLLQ